MATNFFVFSQRSKINLAGFASCVTIIKVTCSSMACLLMKLLDPLRLLVGFLPEVRNPAAGAISFKQKAAYTAASLAVFMAGSHMLLFRTVFRYSASSMAADPLYWRDAASASNSDTIMAMGVIPLIVSEGMAIALVRKNRIIKVDNNSPEDRMLL